MLDYLLPIGSVVRLKDGKKRLMIFGVKQTHPETNETFDYIGVLFPEGNIGTEFQVLFHHKDIEHVYFEGLRDSERTAFMEQLEKILSEE